MTISTHTHPADRDLIAGPADNEQGHAEHCRRLTAAVAEWPASRPGRRAVIPRRPSFTLPDDGIIDLIAVEIAASGNRPVALTPPERQLAAARILAQGGTPALVSKRLHVNGTTALTLAARYWHNEAAAPGEHDYRQRWRDPSVSAGSPKSLSTTCCAPASSDRLRQGAAGSSARAAGPARTGQGPEVACPDLSPPRRTAGSRKWASAQKACLRSDHRETSTTSTATRPTGTSGETRD